MRTDFAKRTHRGGLARGSAGSRMTSGLEGRATGMQVGSPHHFLRNEPTEEVLVGEGGQLTDRRPGGGEPVCHIEQADHQFRRRVCSGEGDQDRRATYVRPASSWRAACKPLKIITSTNTCRR